MPELPEVETIRRHLSPVLDGRSLRDLEVRHPRMLRYQPGHSLPSLSGRRIRSVGRLGKYLLIGLDGPLTWVTHLGMSGRIQLAVRTQPEASHTHVVARFDDDGELRMVDPRTFGFIQVLDEKQLSESTVGRLGPDALDDGADGLRAKLKGRKASIKTLLLDQRLVAGIGNIYADEILHRARIRGDRPAGSLSAAEIRRLQGAIRPVLTEGLRWGGTSLDDLAYLLPDGTAGEYLGRLRVYGRQDEPCPRCGADITRSRIGGRGTFWCSKCQK